MGLTWLDLQCFRSFERLRWEVDPKVNVLVGPNGAGKTNLLEAIGYLATLKSFRGANDAVLLRGEAERAVIRGEVAHERGESLVEIEIPAAGRRLAQVNRRRLVRAADLLGSVQTVVFLPDDLDIVKRGPSYRRDWLDSVAVQLWPGAYQDQQEYERALRQRNALLRQMGRGTDFTSLEVWDQRLSQAGSKLIGRRLGIVAALEQEATRMYQKLSESDSQVRLEYQAGWAPQMQPGEAGWESVLREALAQARVADVERRVSTVGPHRDDLILWLDDRNTRTHSSQGEQRTTVLALRLASHRAVRYQVGTEPILLLDDVFSELDGTRTKALVEALPGGQTFITTARDEEVPLQGRRWQVGQGRVR